MDYLVQSSSIHNLIYQKSKLSCNTTAKPITDIITGYDLFKNENSFQFISM